MKKILFTDLDGTLLNEKYSYKEVQPAIVSLIARKVAVVLCSSKTKVEIELYRKQLAIGDPFISENGAAIYIPKNYFKHAFVSTRQTEKYWVIELGVQYSELRRRLLKVAARAGARIVGFGDMTVEEIVQDTGLSLEVAELAKQREFDEPFRIERGDEKKIFAEIAKEELCVTKGDRYHHLSGGNSKGAAVACLVKLFRRDFGETSTVAVGNSENDLSMLKAADLSFFVKKTDVLGTMWERIAACIL